MTLDLAPDPDPETDEGRLAWLRLARSRNVGAASFRRLLNRFGTAEKAVEALPGLAARGGARAYEACSLRQGEAEMEHAAIVGARMLRLGSPDYPAALAEIPDPPPFLWALGDPALAADPGVAVIGARNASSIGLRMARLLAGGLGEAGHVVVSGLARGIDAAAHGAALETGTVAVLAGGVDHIYPKENEALAGEIAEKGLLVSEAPMGLAPQGRHFPRRNRIVSGLSRGVVLIEAAARSGSLITARFALEQGREAMAAPGAPLDPRAEGCNDLIRHGAALIRSVEDVEEALAAPRTLSFREEEEIYDPPPEAPPPEDLSARAAALLGPAAVEVDDLARDLDVPPSHLAAALIELELAGAIERRAGGLVALAG
ncbi:MAG: DNA-processing protein DprA [Pseudomonadota bacterium]